MVDRNGEGEGVGQGHNDGHHSSLSGAQRPSRGNNKQYVCTYENCNKSFTRSDHLRRHTLNHGTGRACPRCSVHFNRPDLLDRHLARHRQKDEEAGGYGLGVVETRKRMWRDAEGNIVTKRPTLPNNNPSVTFIQNDASPGDQQSEDSNVNTHMPQHEVPLPTPRSMGSYSSNNRQQFSPRVPASAGQWDADLATNFTSDPEMCDFLNNSSWGSQQQQPFPTGTNNPFDDMFNPDTASSFNMPFTTMNNYNWLFDGNGFDTEFRMPGGDQTQNKAYQPVQVSAFDVRNANGNSNGNQFNGTLAQDTRSSNGYHMPAQNGGFSEAVQAEQVQTVPHQLDPMSNSNSSVMGISTTASSYEQSRYDESSPGNFSHHSLASNSQSSVSEPEPPKRQHNHPQHFEQTLSGDAFQTPRRRTRTNLPTIDQVTRRQVLDLIIQARPKTPEGTPITRDHNLLSLSAMQNYCDLFFCKFNITYPILHRATFEPSRAETLLLVSVLLLGATYGDKDGHRLAVCIHDVLRAQIFSNAAFRAQPELWVLQTILLVECFGKSRAGQTQHDMAHLFHGLLINLIRRSDCQIVCHPNYDDGARDLESNWRLFVDVEQRKRLAFLCFLWDTQHAVLFSQSLCMSAFELRSSLPCNPTTWESDSAEDWYKSFSKETETWFLTVLKLYVNPDSVHSPPPLNDLSRLLILHGLMSISWDMKRREQTALGFAGPDAQERQARLAQSYDTWKADFDTHCMSMSLSLRDNAALKKDFTRFSTASIAIYHAAHIILNIEIIDLQIYAGATHIIGRPVTRADFERSRRIVKQWARPSEGQAAAKAAWHAAHLLRDGIMNLDDWDVNDVFHYPWCLYLATLTCWAFHFASGDKDDHDPGNRVLRHIIQHTGPENAQAEMSALVSGMTSATADGLWRVTGKYDTGGLISMIAKHLSTIRWAVVHEGMKILRGLVAERQ